MTTTNDSAALAAVLFTFASAQEILTNDAGWTTECIPHVPLEVLRETEHKLAALASQTWSDDSEFLVEKTYYWIGHRAFLLTSDYETQCLHDLDEPVADLVHIPWTCSVDPAQEIPF